MSFGTGGIVMVMRNAREVAAPLSSKLGVMWRSMALVGGSIFL